MPFVGMTVSVVRDLSRGLTSQTDELRSIRTKVDQLMADASRVWEGADIVRFRNQWFSYDRPRLQASIDRLNMLADQLTRQATQQEQTSGDSPGVSPDATNRPRYSGPEQDTPEDDSDWLKYFSGLLKGAKTVGQIIAAAKVLGSGYSVDWVKRWIALSKVAKRLFPIVEHQEFSTAYNTVVDKASALTSKLNDLSQYSKKFGTAAKVVGTAGRVFGGVLGAAAVIGGVNQAVNGNGHEGVVDVGDRISGGLNAVGGAGFVALAIGGAALMATPAGPVIVGVAIAATAVAAAWDFAQWCNDGGLKSAGESLSNWSAGLQDSDRTGLLGNLERAAGTGLGAIGSGMTKVGSWLKGLW